MKYLILTILFLITSINVSLSQDKVIKGDTAFWYPLNMSLFKKFKLTDFSKTHNNFCFRFFADNGQVVEIIKNHDSITGVLINYTSRYKKGDENESNIKSVFNKITLTSSELNAAYKIIQNSQILNIQSDKMIEKWKQGDDGITYFIEHSDSNVYWFKTYWTPNVQDTFPESIIVNNFVKSFSEALFLNKKFDVFIDSLPDKGCYSSGGMTFSCYNNGLYGLGYTGSTKLPFGYNIDLKIRYLGNLRINSVMTVQQQFDKHSNYNFSFTFDKGNLLFNRRDKKQDFILYNYRKTSLNFVESKIASENHQFCYGLSIPKKYFRIAIGADYLQEENRSIGGMFYTSKSFRNTYINIFGKTSIFKNYVDYQIGIIRPFFIKRRFPITVVGLSYEKFINYKDLT